MSIGATEPLGRDIRRLLGPLPRTVTGTTAVALLAAGLGGVAPSSASADSWPPTDGDPVYEPEAPDVDTTVPPPATPPAPEPAPEVAAPTEEVAPVQSEPEQAPAVSADPAAIAAPKPDCPEPESGSGGSPVGRPEQPVPPPRVHEIEEQAAPRIPVTERQPTHDWQQQAEAVAAQRGTGGWPHMDRPRPEQRPDDDWWRRDREPAKPPEQWDRFRRTGPGDIIEDQNASGGGTGAGEAPIAQETKYFDATGMAQGQINLLLSTNGDALADVAAQAASNSEPGKAPSSLPGGSAWPSVVTSDGVVHAAQLASPTILELPDDESLWEGLVKGATDPVACTPEDTASLAWPAVA